MSQDEFWDRIHAVNAGMLDATGGKRSVPMSHYPDSDSRTLWFITAAGTDVVDAVADGPIAGTYSLADGGKGLYAHLHGELSLSHDADKLDDIWSTVADAWFEDGKDDPDVRLVCFTITGGEAWLPPTGSVAFMLGIARAQLTGKQPDMGEHIVL